MSLIYHDRFFLEKSRICQLAIFSMLVALTLIAMVFLFNHEKQSLISQGEVNARQAVGDINRIFQEVDRGIDVIITNSDDMVCPRAINKLMDTATRNPYAMVYYLVDKFGNQCSSYNNDSQINNIAQLLKRAMFKQQEGVYLSSLLERPVFILVRYRNGIQVVGVVDARYIVDLFLEHNSNEAVNYSLMMTPEQGGLLLNTIGLAPKVGDIAVVPEYSDKYGFGVGSQVRNDAYIIIAMAKVYGWLIIFIFGLSVVAYVLLTNWVKRIDFMYRDICKGITKNEFIPYIQPIVDSDTLEVIGGEVLVRWAHPIYGMLNPAEFVELAERTGVIIPITERLMECVANRFGAEDVLLPPNFTFNINVTLAHLVDPVLVHACSAFLGRFSEQAKPRLCLELIERGSLSDYTEQQMMDSFKTLRVQGIRFAVDDYGTGYSSLRHVYSSYIDTIKIDRLFIKDIESNKMAYEIVMNIIDLALRIGAKVVAEGVETTTQAAFLKKMGVDCFQGYLYGKPVPMDTFITSFMRKQCLHQVVSTR
ncbi:EAL domain-containing protein [Aeromonas veronii]|uniref:EAL domain-containing protein n=1 Tax=Aeromonas veronii TaxID=654 RepID=UPI003BA158AE